MAIIWSRLPHLPPQFNESTEERFRELDSFSDQLLERLTMLRDAESSVETKEIRRTLLQWWQEDFADFDLQISKRKRRPLFRLLMGMALRQVSSMTEQIAHAIVLRDASDLQRANTLFKSGREAKLFNLRYGACPALGNINIGFLYDCGELHASLVNTLASSLIAGKDDEAWREAERELHAHVLLLGQARAAVTAIEREKKSERREHRSHSNLIPTGRAENHADLSLHPPGHIDPFLDSLQERASVVMERLKDRDRQKVQAVLDHGGDFKAASESLGIEPKRFRRQWRETVLKNVSKIIERIDA